MSGLGGQRPMSSSEYKVWDDVTRSRKQPSGAWRILIVCAGLLALLPLPVGALHLLPAYHIQGRFLTLYTPLICVLILAYLVYIRDSFTRLVFGDILDPIPNYYPHYPERPHDRRRRRAYKARGVLLNLVPALLLAASFYFGVQYLHRLDRSVTLAIRILAERIDAPESAFAPGSVGGDSTGVGNRGAAGAGAGAGASREASAAKAASSARARQVVLRNTGNDEVPMFTQLTALYVGMFAAAVLALTILALKEYAKAELGLTERELILGHVPDA